MREFMRLLRLFAPAVGWLGAGFILMLATLAAQSFTLGSAGLVLLGSIAVAGSALAYAGALRPLLRYAERLTTHSATFRVLARLRLWLFARLIPLAPAVLGTRRAGDVLARLLSDIDQLDGFVLRLLLPLAVGLLALGSVLAIFLVLHAPVMLVLALLVTGLAAMFMVFIHRRTAQSSAQLPTYMAELRSQVLDGCEGLPDLLASHAADVQLHKITFASAGLMRSKLAQTRTRILLQLATGVLGGCLLALLVLAASQSGYAAPMLLGLFLLAFGLLETLPALGQSLSQWPLLQSAAARIFALADMPPAVTEPTIPAPLPKQLDLTFENVTLSYGRKHAALKQINLTFTQGARVLITGPSGAGKTSVLQLLLKFAVPTSGAIKVGNVALSDLSGDVWRTQIAVLSQNTALLAGSVRENLCLAAPQASEAELWQALEHADLASFVRSLPDGLETWVGEGGAAFSGGQARRLALAQMLLKNAPIWLLDEPTEGLDAHSAHTVLGTIAGLAGPRTLLFITHQPELGALINPTQQIKLQAGCIAP